MNSKTWLMSGIAATAMLMGACASSDNQRTAGQTVDDSAIAAKAKAELVRNDATKARNIDVEVRNGEVQLNGFVASAQEKSAAAASVARLEGVKGVRNNLQIQGGSRSAGDVVDDTIITTKVKAALIGDSRTKAHQIEVETRQGEVQLGGFVDSADAKAAATEVAKSVSGVKAVSNGLQVKD